MFDNNENLVAGATENVDQTTEKTGDTEVEAVPEKTFTQSELNEIVQRNKARAEAKVRKEYDRKYGNLTQVLRAGTGKESVEDITQTFAEFYEKKGIKVSSEPNYTAKDIEVLARAEADDIIRSGYEDVVEEVDRLTEIGVANMTAREKALFKALAEHRQNTERHNELSKIGVSDEVYNSREFQEFAKDFNPNTPVEKIWRYYQNTLPKKDIKPMGSMKNTPTNEVKDFYSAEEIARLTEDDLRNPEVWNIVRRSMTGV
jgi:hypothetical protein